MYRRGMFICFVFYLLFPANIIGLWWVKGSPLIMDPNRICKKSRRVGRKQHSICLREPEIVQEIANGAKMAISECRYQLRSRRWNCPTKRKGIAKVLRLDSKETGFVNALSAAGVVHAVTQACTMGLLLQCTCDHMVNQDMATDGRWEWGGCGDDVLFGYNKSKDFMDIVKRKKRRKQDTSTKLLLHNNEAGRLAVKDYMRTACKCHGLSASCTLKTCWRKMPLFRHVGEHLVRRYDNAIKVMLYNDGARLIPTSSSSRQPSEEDIVFSAESPNYCVPNKTLGSLGTMGRMCNVTSGGLGGCDLLCCGRGYYEERVLVDENCRCRFEWCCDVYCQTCVTEKVISRCN